LYSIDAQERSSIVPENENNDAQSRKQGRIEDETEALQSQLNFMRAERDYWRSKATGTGTDSVSTSVPLEEQTVLERGMNGLRQMMLSSPATTPTSKIKTKNSVNGTPTNNILDDEESLKFETGLHHRKNKAVATAPSTWNCYDLSPFQFIRKESVTVDTPVADRLEGLSLIKAHASDVGDNSSVDSDSDEPTFAASLMDRGLWLIGLLMLQSFSSFILKYNEKLLQRHVVIIQFLTMLVGAGGNAGNQASVRVIRGLATGRVHDDNAKEYVLGELTTGLLLSIALGVAGCIRALVFFTPIKETIAVTSSLIMIVSSSILLGTLLPLGMRFIKIDPAHASTTIQVIMDILGVAITVGISSLILGP